ncbi:MAG: formylglycine-generating enzyme family protein [Phycisphaerae bacterium]|nr:formylglycine-generating enzyme family protein [Phycisphaerae bacterium]
MKIRLLLAALLVGLCLSSCSRKDRGKQPEREDSSRGATTRPSAPQKPAGPPRSIDLDLGDGVTMKLVLIPAGKFMMGGKSSPAEVARKFHRYGGQEAYYTAEHPQREVTISKPFYMGIWEVTRPQWDAVMGPGPWKGKKCDNSDAGNVANHVSWTDASKFCEKLSQKTGKTVALPTEAQWEYACRAKRKEAYSFGDDESKLGLYAWFAENALGVNEPYPHRAGLKTPNFWGLYDMHGNAAEWCRDWYDEKFYASAGAKSIDPENTTAGTHRVLRGGAWGQYPDSCRSAYRSGNTPAARKCSYGFRVMVAIDTGGSPTTRRGGVPEK